MPAMQVARDPFMLLEFVRSQAADERIWGCISVHLHR